ncbi:MAG: GldG family protein, partial [Treponema sp.]|nr:GldG family protein [Treponema sp.]
MKEIKAFNSIRQSFKTRQVKYGGYAALITLAVIAGLILINLLVGQFSPQVDMTSARLFSLSEQTIKLLDSINSPVKFYGLWRPGEENTDVISVINLYLSKSRNISFEVIDPDRNPGFVARYDRNRTGIQRGSLIVEGKNGFRIINPYDMYELAQNQQGGSTVTGVSVERRITSALLFSETGNTPVIYEITGHGETPLSALGYQNVLEQENFSVKSLNLLTAIIPTDASALMLINPTGDLNSQEADKLLNYLEKGGRLLIMADYNIRELTNLNTVLASYGLALDYGVIVESDLNYQIASVPFSLVPDAVDHEITKLLLDKTRTPVLLIGAMSLSTLETRRRTIEISPLLVSSRNAFLRTDLNNISNVKT